LLTFYFIAVLPTMSHSGPQKKCQQQWFAIKLENVAKQRCNV